MARPKSKKELMVMSQQNFDRLNTLIDTYPLERQLSEFPEGTMNRNIRDVLAHLHHWHLMMIEWHEIGMNGGKPAMPAKGYTWRQTPELNRTIWKKYQAVDLQQARYSLNNSFIKLQNIIRQHSNEELFEKKRYLWTGSTSLGAYLVSATSSHYDWAYKIIRKALNDL